MIVSIQDFVQSKIIKKIEIEVVSYSINTSALCNVNFLDSSDKIVSNALVSIDGEDFSTNWTTDQDLINIVLSKLGLVPL